MAVTEDVTVSVPVRVMVYVPAGALVVVVVVVVELLLPPQPLITLNRSTPVKPSNTPRNRRARTPHNPNTPATSHANRT